MFRVYTSMGQRGVCVCQLPIAPPRGMISITLTSFLFTSTAIPSCSWQFTDFKDCSLLGCSLRFSSLSLLARVSFCPGPHPSHARE